MTDRSDWAASLLETAARDGQETVQLAHLLTPAVRIERALLRAVRLRFLPWSDTGLESDLWFSQLVESRASSAIVLQRDVARLLQGRLLQSERWIYDEVRAFIVERHRGAAPILQLEEALFHDTREGAPPQALEQGLERVLNALTDPDQPIEVRLEIARWVQNALADFLAGTPPSPLAELVGLTSAAYLGLPVSVHGDQPRASAAEAAWVLPEALREQRFDIGITFSEGELRFTSPDADGSRSVKLAGFRGIPAKATWDDASGPAARWTSLTPGLEVPLPRECRRIELETLAGEVLAIDAIVQQQPAGSGASVETATLPAVFVIRTNADAAAFDLVRAALSRADYETLRVDSFGDGGGEAGRHWEYEVRRALTEADIVIAILSGASSRTLWTIFETVQAIAMGKRFLPVRIDDSALPELLAPFQRFDLDLSAEASLQAFTEQVGSMLAQPRSTLSPSHSTDLADTTDVFLSHAVHEMEHAQRIRDGLRGQGFRVETSSADPQIGAGHSEPWPDTMERTVGSAKTFVPLVTEAAEISPWALAETAWAETREKPIFVAKLASNPQFERLANYPAFELSPDFETGLARLSEALRAQLAVDPAFVDPADPRRFDLCLATARQDETRARVLVNVLQARGWRTYADFMDSALFGKQPDSVAAILEQRMGRSDHVIMLWSKAAAAGLGIGGSLDAVVHSERQLIGVRLDDTRSHPELKAEHWLDLVDWNGNPKAPNLMRALAQLARIIGAPDDTVATETPDTRNVGPTTGRAKFNAGSPFVQTERIPPELREQVLAYQAELDDEKTEPPRRTQIGDELAELGDPRAGVGLLSNGLPDIRWLKVPEGPFIYQAGERLALPAFWIAAYAITNAQYQAFIDDGGYRDEGWWAGLAERLEIPNESSFPHLNQPRTDVSWYEAVAFCRWLSAKLGYGVRLPKEQEWEKAARGEDGREYPWGNKYRSGYANVNETEQKGGPWYLKRPSAVGMYPQGVSPCGAQDMAGNVWEWCQNEYKKPDRTQDSGDELRVLRGGSWDNDPDYARASLRDYYHPDDRYGNGGFRVWCSSNSRAWIKIPGAR